MKKLVFLLAFGILLITSCTDDSGTEVETVDFSNTVFTSNNTNGNVWYYSIDAMGNITDGKEVMTTSTAADGVYYDESTDEIIQASRSEFGVDIIADASTAIPAGTIETQRFGAGDLMNPRETAVTDDFIVVADSEDVDGDAATPDGRLFIYSRTSSGVMLRNTITTDFKVWGILFIGEDLYAIVDADDELAVFNNFLNNTNDMMLSADKRVVVEGIVHTHGLAYDMSTNTMILTDIGEASNTTDDGGFHIIQNFSTVFDATSNEGMIGLADQIRVSGSNTMLGNPVDVAYDGANDIVYIAEIGNSKLLSFKDAKSGGNLMPTSSVEISKVSCVYLNK